MTLVDVETHCEATPAQVWATLVDWEQQTRWLHAASVHVVGAPSGGLGTRVRRRVALAGGLAIASDLIVTEWAPGRRLGLRRDGRGLVGIGAFELAATDLGTHLRWWEALAGPLGPLGDAGLALFAPLLERARRQALARLKALTESAGAAR